MKHTFALLFLSNLLLVNAFLAPSTPNLRVHYGQSNLQTSLSAAATTKFEVLIDMPPSGSNLKAQLKVDPILDVPSELVEVRYAVPFGLNVEPKGNLAICTKDGSGGEKVGDVLRYTSQWTIGLPQGDGVVSTLASFGGGVSWQCSLFNVMKAKVWEQVVEALVSNVESRTDEVVLIFERPLAEEAES